MTYEQVKKDFLSGRIKGCKSFFKHNNYVLEAAYCCIILDQFEEAKELFTKVAGENIRAHWGLLLLQMLTGEISRPPTYFEVRNFLEIDLNIFILYCRGDFVEKIIRYADYLAFYNPECYKFIGRVFWANNLMPAAMFFLRKAKDKLYNDPELHYLLAYIYYYNDNDIEKCQRALSTCLEILPNYAPAVKLFDKILTL
ncbi:hypothetical protein HDR58_08780 [bacterium]|nr:hypothetical protein [bacterium]